MQVLLAFFLFSIIMITQHRASLQAEVRLINQAVSVLAEGVAVERLEEVASKGFDQATVDNISITSPGSLTSPSKFGPLQDRAGDDVDDFDATQVIISRGTQAGTLDFTVATEVYYVQDPTTDEKATEPRKYKMVRVTVTTDNMDFPNTIELSQVISCKSACQW
jgi:hypothetical protein